MSRKPTDFSQIITLLNELHKSFPKYNIGRHISTALDGEDLWGISDKQLLDALNKYSEEQEIDNPYTNERELESIISDGMNLDHLFDEEEEY
jgi:hypothetical protein